MSTESPLHDEPAVDATSASNSAPEGGEDAEIEKLPPKAWVTLGLFAVFVIAFGTCASTYFFK